MIRVTLPWPPSVNHYWRHCRGRTFISKDGTEYRTTVNVAMRDVLIPYDRLAVVIHAVPPDKRIRDLDNLLKAPLDAITHARAWPDDGLIDRLEIIRYQPEKPGRIVLAITAAETTQRYEL